MTNKVGGNKLFYFLFFGKLGQVKSHLTIHPWVLRFHDSRILPISKLFGRLGHFF